MCWARTNEDGWRISSPATRSAPLPQPSGPCPHNSPHVPPPLLLHVLSLSLHKSTNAGPSATSLGMFSRPPAETGCRGRVMWRFLMRHWLPFFVNTCSNLSRNRFQGCATHTRTCAQRKTSKQEYRSKRGFCGGSPPVATLYWNY